MQKIKAKKSLGQNFLIDHEALADIASAIDITDQHIIEVWPGYGALTDYLVTKNPKSLDLVELDPDMISILEKRNENWEFTIQSSSGFAIPNLDSQIQRNETDPQLTIHHIDVLQFTPPYDCYSVIANIPYYITSPILFYFLYELEQKPDAMVIMMQEEVGEKILEGRARKPHHSYLSLCMEQVCQDIEIVRYVGKSSFDPAPRVDSIVLRFVMKEGRNTSQEKELMDLWRVAFAHPRKSESGSNQARGLGFFFITMPKQKYYTVWKWRQTGIFDNWDACKKSVDGYVWARYKSYPTRSEAEAALRWGYTSPKQKDPNPPSQTKIQRSHHPILPSLSVDWAWNTVTGWCEYQWVMTDHPETRILAGWPYADGTNNIVEFLGLVHALRYCQSNDLPTLPIYTDSVTAMAWVRNKVAKTTQSRNHQNAELFGLLDDATLWLQSNSYKNPILKWETRIWGEIPADFGRK
jgi:ribonuclease HI